MALRDKSILDAVAQGDLEDPLPQKDCKDRTIYLSRNDFGFQPDNIGRPVITDFGLSISGKVSLHNHTIRPRGFRAPEVVLGVGWSYSVDIWNLGAMVRLNDFIIYLLLLEADILTRRGNCYAVRVLLVVSPHLQTPLSLKRST